MSEDKKPVKVTLNERALFKDCGFAPTSRIVRMMVGPHVSRTADRHDKPDSNAQTIAMVFKGPDNEKPDQDVHVVGQLCMPLVKRHTDAEMLAAGCLSQYIHECGEHVQVEGINTNPHTREGFARQLQLLEQVVIPWMRTILKEQTTDKEFE